VAVGAIFLGSLATANRLAPAEGRGHAISAFFVACYAGLIIPVVGVGVLSGFTGTFPAVLAFSIVLAVLCLFSITRIASGGRDGESPAGVTPPHPGGHEAGAS
jgi:uncharacterized membrane protein